MNHPSRLGVARFTAARLTRGDPGTNARCSTGGSTSCFDGAVPRSARTAPRRAPRQKRAEDTVTTLLDATEIVLAEDGFTRTNTNPASRSEQASASARSTTTFRAPRRSSRRSSTACGRASSAQASRSAPRSSPRRRSTRWAIHAIVSALVEVIAERRVLYQRWYAEASHLGQLGTGLEDVGARGGHRARRARREEA